MHTLPVDGKILEEALVQLGSPSGGTWLVQNNLIKCSEHVLWNLHGLHAAPEWMSDEIKHVKHLLKSRRTKELQGWWDHSYDERQAIFDAQMQKTGISYETDIWPVNATTGAEYVEACAWYDRVEAELGEGEAVSKTPADVQHQRPDVSNHTLLDALEFAVPGGWAVSDAWIQRHQIRFWDRERGLMNESGPASQLVRLLTQDRQHSSGRLTGLTSEMNDDADRFAGQVKSMWPWRAETGEKYLRACAAYDHLIAQKTDHVGGSPNDELAEVKEAWSGLIPGAADAEEVDSRTDNADGTTTFVHESMHLTFTREEMAESERPAEQPWERDKRVAASAGYVHVTEDTSREDLRHTARCTFIHHGVFVGERYAHTQPPVTLSGTRIDNGWAVSGFAVTDAVAQDRPAWTLADKQGACKV